MMRGCHEAQIYLLEVMLALAIFALAATAVFQIASGALVISTFLRKKR
ncbi:hypothetical protein ACNKHR_18135 [Shigella flexneri]